MDNPYRHHDQITEPERFYGRKGIITRIYSRIGVDRPQSMSIVGEPKIGKSSLLQILYHEQTKRDYLDDPDSCLYISMPLKEEHLDGPQAFFQVVLDRVRNQTSALADTMAEPSYDGFGRLVEALESSERKLILFMDDFNMATQDKRFPLEFFSFLRSIANNYNTAYITTSHEELQKLCVSQEVGESPFFNIFTNVTLKGLAPDELAQLVAEPSQEAGASLQPFQDVIVDLAGYFPYLDQMACEILFSLQPDGTVLTSSTLEDLRTRFMAQAQPFFQGIWDGFSQQERDICQAVLNTGNPARQVEFVAKNLQRRGYLENENGAYRLFCASFRMFVAEQCGVDVGWAYGGKGVLGWLKSVLK